jgi:hypothetical protein
MAHMPGLNYNVSATEDNLEVMQAVLKQENEH